MLKSLYAVLFTVIAVCLFTLFHMVFSDDVNARVGISLGALALYRTYRSEFQ